MDKIPLIAVVGPTASGKTKLGVSIAELVCGEVVSADSMQIYKDMPIASAVPSEAEKRGIPHHLIEFLEYGERFSVSDYVNLANKTIKDIISRNTMPILVGGTGLYVNSLVDGVEFVEAEVDEKLRQSLSEQFDNIGAEEMLKKLAEFDEDTARRLNTGDKRRIIRAFEVYLTTGITVSKQNELSKQKGSAYKSLLIGITYKDRQKLYERIEKRVDLMLENGLLEEAYQSFCKNVNSSSAQAIGHKEFYPYFKGEQGLEESVQKLKTETRRYAKRQLTWFNKRDDVNWIYADECDTFEAAKKILENF
ncbi:MAG: tRNA (adenosine(37)-N6)-dimethylallyltransferase MiaA [Clostridiales bacterium]|nr:tRNA (adenosine(37)-N6)-dimethylallyltransferase MiaA [Candidatus Equinaster intestinalis]